MPKFLKSGFFRIAFLIGCTFLGSTPGFAQNEIHLVDLFITGADWPPILVKAITDVMGPTLAKTLYKYDSNLKKAVVEAPHSVSDSSVHFCFLKDEFCQAPAYWFATRRFVITLIAPVKKNVRTINIRGYCREGDAWRDCLSSKNASYAATLSGGDISARIIDTISNLSFKK